MARLDHSKGGHYEPDPARVQRTQHFDMPHNSSAKGKRKPADSIWGEAMKARRRAEITADNIKLGQDELLKMLEVRRRNGRVIARDRVLKRLTREGLLLANGTPNLDHPKVIELMSQRRRAR